MSAPERWLVIGASGRLGRELCDALRGRGHTVAAPSRGRLDVTDGAAVARYLSDWAPDITVNCAAWTRVDDAERHEAEALRINAEAPRYLARACRATRSRLFHLSTDAVFSPAAGHPPRPFPEDHPPAPVNAYGRSKHAGERAVLEELPHRSTVVRTAWLYGRHGSSFVRTMLRHAAGQGTVRVAHDQYGQPTSATDVLCALLALADAPPARTTGVFHATCLGSTTWYGLAREVFRLAGADPDRVEPVTTASLGRPAPRPAWSVLGHDRWRELGVLPVRPWAEALAAFCRTEVSACCGH